MRVLRLHEGGQNDEPPRVLLLPILAVEDAPQALVLGDGPQNHLVGPRCHENVAPKRLGGDVEAQPAINLGSVVCARDIVEEEAPRDLVALLSRLAQVPLDHMTPEVR